MVKGKEQSALLSVRTVNDERNRERITTSQREETTDETATACAPTLAHLPFLLLLLFRLSRNL